ADGQTLTVDEGSWAGTLPLQFAYQWRRCNSSGSACVNIGGANANTYVVASADVGSTLRATVSASNSAGSSYSGAVLRDDPSSCWRLEDGGGTAVDQQTAHDATYVGSPQQAASGLLSGDADTAVTLNGTSQYVDVPGDPGWTPAGAFSIEV